jgi:hypothetical protein
VRYLASLNASLFDLDNTHIQSSWHRWQIISFSCLISSHVVALLLETIRRVFEELRLQMGWILVRLSGR